MAISIFDLFKIGIGPSSSHTVGPMRAALLFAQRLKEHQLLAQVARIKTELFGSLGATGRGHGSPKAVMLGLEGEIPEQVEVDLIPARTAAILENRRLRLLTSQDIAFDPEADLILHRRKTLPGHPNGMLFSAFGADGRLLLQAVYYSVGGGFVVDEQAQETVYLLPDATPVAYEFDTAAELLQRCQDTGLSISAILLANEKSWREPPQIEAQLLRLWQVMQDCIHRGCHADGVLPGGLNLKRRAPALYGQLTAADGAANETSPQHSADMLSTMDWVTLYALAVNEENAAGGRVVTAPTNGAAGIIPAVLSYYMRFHRGKTADVVDFLLTAGAIGMLYKKNASISGAEVGCQGEVGSACSMAAAGLAQVFGGTAEQIENAAEIAMEHHLGLTCDPIGGLVQIPCIERNAMAAVTAINAARMALRGDGKHLVSLDKVIRTMRETGRDMRDKYKETSRGGLALNLIEVPVNIIEC